MVGGGCQKKLQYAVFYLIISNTGEWMDAEISWSIPADSAELAGVRARLRAILGSAGFDDKAVGEVLLAVDERLSNIIRHAYAGRREGRIDLKVFFQPHQARISVRDYGERFNPLKAPLPQLPPTQPGGLGNFLTRALMDEVHYDETCTDGNLLHLIKYLKNKKPAA